MKEYFISIMAVSLVGSVIIAMVSGNSTSKYLKLLCGLCMVGCIVFPLTSVANWSLDSENILKKFDYENGQEKYYDEIYNSSLGKFEIINAEISLKSEILKELSASNDDFDLNIITNQNADGFYISSVVIKVHSSGIDIDPRRIEKYVLKRLNCPCEIVYDL